MMCMVCNAVASGETNPDHETIVLVLGLLESDFTTLAKLVGRLCEPHRRVVRACAAKNNAEFYGQRERLDQ